MNLRYIIICGVTALCAAACVSVDTHIGQGFIPIEQQYDVRHAEFKLTDIRMDKMDKMSGYSSRRITVGSMRDEVLGLSKRSSAFTLVPYNDTLDFGKNAKIRDFRVSLQRDTVNVINDAQSKIMQCINVYSVRDAGIRLDTLTYMEYFPIGKFESLTRITDGIPVYDGGDSLSFSFSKAYAEAEFSKMIEQCNEDGIFVMDSLKQYLDIFPGIYLSCDEPVGMGGRFNFFDVAISQEEGYVTGNFAELKFTADYGDREKVDTSFIFLFGATQFPEGATVPNQYAYNICEGDPASTVTPGDADKFIYIEGGVGLKPVFSAKEIYERLIAEFTAQGISISDLKEVVINKASIYAPFELPTGQFGIDRYPVALSPTCRIKTISEKDGKEYINWANLTDANISSENHGEIDRSNCIYAPDLSFHAQKIIRLEDPDDATFANYDIWMLIVASELEQSSTTSSSDSQSDYYNQMMYYQYLNSLYGGYGGYGGYGYGGYGGYGYGGYGGYGYSNYYNMMYYSSLMGSSSSSSETYVQEMDRDRFYRAVLNGPGYDDTERRPVLRVTYSVPKSVHKE